ncbi:MAG: hypothetical protein ACI9K2_007596, partial [Myxococcota bacterium]
GTTATGTTSTGTGGSGPTGTATGTTSSGTGGTTTGGTATGGTDTGTADTGGGDTSTTPADPMFTLDLGLEVVCAEPSRRLPAPFDTEALADVDVLHPYHWGGGVSVLDLDGDGTVELIRTTETGILLYERGPSGWTDVTADRLPLLPRGMVASATAADIEGDGDLDLLLITWLGQNRLLRNNGAGVFDDITEGSGLHSERWRHQTGAWGDLDADGDLDLFIGGYGDVPPSSPDVIVDPSRLYLNRGDGTFADATHLLPADIGAGYTFQGTFADLDLDGDQDLAVQNDFTYHLPNQFLLNDGSGALHHDPGAAYAVGVTGMGVELAELNGDGIPDHIISAYREVAVMLSTRLPDGSLTFIRSDAALGIVPRADDPDFQQFAWGVQVGDLDNDGTEELLVMFGDATDPIQHADGRLHWRPSADSLWIEEAPGRWVDRAADWGLANEGVGRGLRLADWNHDGWLDVFQAELNGPTWVHTARCGDGSWLRVALRDDRTMNRYGIGATVELTGPDRSWTEWITAGSTSMYSDGQPEAHFGLGDLEAVDLRITWADGEVTVVDDVPTRRAVVLTRH